MLRPGDIESYQKDGGRCPKCDSKIDGHTGSKSGGGPKDGDFTVCVYCESILRFENDKIRLCTEPEIVELYMDGDGAIGQVLAAVRDIKKKNPGKWSRPKNSGQKDVGQV